MSNYLTVVRRCITLVAICIDQTLKEIQIRSSHVSVDYGMYVLIHNMLTVNTVSKLYYKCSVGRNVFSAIGNFKNSQVIEPTYSANEARAFLLLS